MSSEITHLSEREIRIISVLANAGCGECGRILMGKPGQIVNVRFIRTPFHISGFKTLCPLCWEKYWRGELDEKPQKQG